MKTNKLRVGFIQSPIKFSDPLKQKKSLNRAIQRLLGHNPQLILLPEICLGNTSSKKWRPYFFSAYEKFLDDLQTHANQNGLCFYTSIYEPQKNLGANNALFIQPKKSAQRYQKIHLFKLGNEHKTYLKGRESKNFSSPWGKIAPQVCFDIRFPELLRKQTFKGAQMALVCAQWPQSRADHWISLLKARAIENQIYVLACNRLGEKDGLVFGGQSCVINPWGEVEFIMKGKNQTALFDLNLNNIKRIRKTFPFLNEAQKKYFHFDI